MNKKIKEPKDLIGQEWTCWRCNQKEIITKDGISHIRKNHFERYNLHELFLLHVYDKELENYIWYGTPTIMKTDERI